MMNHEDLLQQLVERLPELEWKISALGSSLSIRSIPRGLFRQRSDMSAATCMAEIRSEIDQLTRQKNEYSSFYLAERIQQQISVLVALCHLKDKNPKSQEKISFSLDKIATRQQWLQSMENEIRLLDSQHQALNKRLAQIKHSGDSEVILQLVKELGEVNKRLTLAKEKLF